MSDLPPNVTAAPDRHGKIRYRFRRKGYPTAYLPGRPGDPEFHRKLASILEAGPSVPAPVTSKQHVIPRSLDDLLRRMKQSPGWRKKGPRTQLVQTQVYQRFMDRRSQSGRRYGERPVDQVTVGWLDKILGSMADTPGAANDLRKKLSVLLDYAVGLEWRLTNPVPHTGKYADGEGHHDWTEEEIEQYRAKHPLGSMARLTLELALNTAARRCNVREIERDHIRGGRIYVAHAKGNNEASVPMLPTTRAAIDALPAAPIRFLIITSFGKPFTAAGLGNRMRKWCDEAGLPQCSLHGLRKAMSRRLAESGATDAEGQAVTGHKKAATFASYRAKANRTVLADRALANLAGRFDQTEDE